MADRRTWLVCEPRVAALSAAFGWLRERVEEARASGRAGNAIAERVSWDAPIERLLA